MTDAIVGRPAPAFNLMCVTAQELEPHPVSLGDYAGRWLIVMFYPRDFSFVCPTELTAFSARLADFRQRNCEMLGVSVDTVELHREWLTTSPDEGGLGPLQFPLASDPEGKAAKAFRVWVGERQVSTRGLFIVDPDGVLQYAVVHNLSVGRSPDEVLRVLEALQTGGLCPASWTSADGMIDPEASLKPGRILGHYRIQSRLGGGTFGTVFAAWDLQLERMVAIKVLKRNIFESRDAILAEARAAARLSHPHVSTIYAVEENDGLPVIVMEYIDGKLLSQTLSEGLERPTALRLVSQIASALAAAHEQHVVHGDLKPANVMVTRQRAAKILDFGLACACPRAQSMQAAADTARPAATPDRALPDVEPDATVDISGQDSVETDRPTAIQGTPAYMSPEQAVGRPANPKSDVFSFGLILYEILTGRRALPEERLIELLVRLENDDLGPQLAPQVDEPYRGLLSSMLAHSEADRPTIADVVQSLAEIRTG